MAIHYHNIRTPFFIFFSIIVYHRTLIIVPRDIYLSFIHSIHNSIHLIIPNSQSIPPLPPLYHGNHKSVLCLGACFCFIDKFICGFPGGLDGKASACNAGDPGLIPALGRSPGGGHGNPLQYSCLENSMDRGAWWAAVPGGRKKSDTNEWLSLLL